MSKLALDNQYCFALYTAANAMTKAYRPLLKAIDLTYPQYLVMLVLWEHSPLRVSGLGERLDLDSGTLTPLLKRLEVKGLVSRTRSTEDERARDIALTSEGSALKAVAQSIPTQVACAAGLSVPELEQLKALCLRLKANFDLPK